MEGISFIALNFHSGTDEMMKDPHKWFPQDFTNRPMIYWLGCAGHWLTHGKAPYEMAGVMCVLMNTLAMFFVYDSTRSFIRSPWLRLSAFAFVAFLPTTLVSTVVYAGDATAGLPFALTLWGLVRCLNAASMRASLGYAVVAMGGLVLGNYCRFPFIGMPVAVFIAVVLVWRWRRVSWQRALAVCAITMIVPSLIGLWINRQAQLDLRGVEEHHTHDWNGTGEMTWRYLLLPLKTDVRIFDSPGYWEMGTFNGKEDHVLCLQHNYSYPALLHLGIYNDVLDYANEGQLDNGQPRPEPQKTLSRWAVRIGVITSLGMFFSVLALVFRSVTALFTGRNAPSTGAGVWGLMALAWFLPVVLAFPYVHFVYESGYFLTRIIITALWGFGLVFFAELDQRLAARPRWITLVVAIFIFAQAALHLRSVWY
jgi:4-amino-4-deoxy-L-arabinose transferase-like glycosyltransferase